MIVVIIILGIALLVLLVLVFLRKVQYDAVHRNFLALEDRYGGKVIRGGFAVRPRYIGEIDGTRFSVSISTEKNKNGKGRLYYISFFMQKAADANFTILSLEWLGDRAREHQKKQATQSIYQGKYQLEASNKKLFKTLNLPRLEDIVGQLHPFSYALISSKGIVLERTSTNLARDTEFERINPVVEGLNQLGHVLQSGVSA